MKLEDLQSEWANDAHINHQALVSESAKVPLLHSKYYKILIEEKGLLLLLRSKQEDLELLLEGFFAKTLTQAELTKHNLVYGEKRVLKADSSKYISTHPKMVELTLKIGVQLEKVKFIEDIIKLIHSRNFTIKNMIDVKKFEAGI